MTSPSAMRCDQAKADFVEVEVGMLGADVMKDAGHCALHPEIEAFDRAPPVYRTLGSIKQRKSGGDGHRRSTLLRPNPIGPTPLDPAESALRNRITTAGLALTPRG